MHIGKGNKGETWRSAEADIGRKVRVLVGGLSMHALRHVITLDPISECITFIFHYTAHICYTLSGAEYTFLLK